MPGQPHPISHRCIHRRPGARPQLRPSSTARLARRGAFPDPSLRSRQLDCGLDDAPPRCAWLLAMPRIELQAVSSYYQGDRAARIPGATGLSLEVAEGAFLVVLGPSGAGKTTLLRLIAGLERPAQGELRFDGVRVNEVAAGDRDVGMMFQTPALFPHLTVRENLGLGLVLRRVDPALIQEAVAGMARRLEIEPLLDRRPGQCSGGEQQRVALGRALVRQPRILLLDEPLSSLDAPLRRQLGEVIVRMHAEFGTTTLLVTHDPHEVQDPATRIVVLESGRIVQTGNLAELRQHPASPFVAAL